MNLVHSGIKYIDLASLRDSFYAKYKEIAITASTNEYPLLLHIRAGINGVPNSQQRTFIMVETCEEGPIPSIFSLDPYYRFGNPQFYPHWSERTTLMFIGRSGSNRSAFYFYRAASVGLSHTPH